VTFSGLNRLKDMSVPNDVLTDAEVVRRVRRGDRDAYRVLVHRYQDTLYRCALSMVGDDDTARDLVQATFVKAFTHLKRLHDDASFGGWVYRACVNACRDHLKSRRRRDIPLDAAGAPVLMARDRADTAIEQHELQRSLDDALQMLPDEHREAFVLKHVDERSYEEMSAVLGASVPALKMRVHRAREALKKALEEVL
jgi:RNA polymerase sigma-70 factor (ECF subfamily)